MTKSLDVDVPKVSKKLRAIARKLETPHKNKLELDWCEMAENPTSSIDQIEIKFSANLGVSKLTFYNMFVVDDNDEDIIETVKDVIRKRKAKLLKISEEKPQILMTQLKDLVSEHETSKPKKTKGTVGFLE